MSSRADHDTTPGYYNWTPVHSGTFITANGRPFKVDADADGTG